jgi:hypothetical protein
LKFEMIQKDAIIGHRNRSNTQIDTTNLCYV